MTGLVPLECGCPCFGGPLEIDHAPRGWGLPEGDSRLPCPIRARGCCCCASPVLCRVWCRHGVGVSFGCGSHDQKKRRGDDAPRWVEELWSGGARWHFVLLAGWVPLCACGFFLLCPSPPPPQGGPSPGLVPSWGAWSCKGAGSWAVDPPWRGWLGGGENATKQLPCIMMGMHARTHGLRPLPPTHPPPHAPIPTRTVSRGWW